MPKVFSPQTLEKFEAASASIPLRQLDRAFDAADVRLGKDPGGPQGSRRAQFRRYVASVDQRDPQQLERLGDALGRLISEVATSKVEFLVKAAERDGFVFVDDVFRPAGNAPSSFALTSVEEFASIDERGRRLQLLAEESPKEAIDGAKELVESVCRTILRHGGKTSPGKTAALVDVAKAALETLESTAAVRQCAEQLSTVVAQLGELRKAQASHQPARLAVGAAVTFAGFVADTYLEQTGT